MCSVNSLIYTSLLYYSLIAPNPAVYQAPAEQAPQAFGQHFFPSLSFGQLSQGAVACLDTQPPPGSSVLPRSIGGLRPDGQRAPVHSVQL